MMDGPRGAAAAATPPHGAAACYLIAECRTRRDAPLGKPSRHSPKRVREMVRAETRSPVRIPRGEGKVSWGSDWVGSGLWDEGGGTWVSLPLRHCSISWLRETCSVLFFFTGAAPSWYGRWWIIAAFRGIHSQPQATVMISNVG